LISIIFSFFTTLPLSHSGSPAIHILWQFGIQIFDNLVYICCGHLVYWFPFLCIVPRKIWQPYLVDILTSIFADLEYIRMHSCWRKTRRHNLLLS
jgi:hypothetical protein